MIVLMGHGPQKTIGLGYLQMMYFIQSDTSLKSKKNKNKLWDIKHVNQNVLFQTIYHTRNVTTTAKTIYFR